MRLVAVFARALCTHVKLANRVDFIPKKLDAEWVFAAEGLNVQNAAAHAKLSQPINGGNAFETAVD